MTLQLMHSFLGNYNMHFNNFYGSNEAMKSVHDNAVIAKMCFIQLLLTIAYQICE